MLHTQQVMERYDAAGEPMLQYFELWIDASHVMQRELGKDGRALSCAFSDESAHLAWAPDTLKAEKREASAAIRMVNNYTLSLVAISLSAAGRRKNQGL